MNKILFISNIASRITSFDIASISAAEKTELEFYHAANWESATSEQIKSDEAKYGIKINSVHISRNPLSKSNIKAYRELVELVKREKIDYIHCNTPTGGLLGRLVGKKCKIKKVIYQVHGFHFYKGAPKKNWLLYYPIEKWLARKTDALITINYEDYEVARKKFKLRDGGNIYYVPGVGINSGDYKVDETTRVKKREELGIPQDAFVIVSAGELNANKNNRVIISAMEKLGNKKLHYVLCGVGDKESALTTQANAAGLNENVHFLGYRTDVKEIYAMSDCFVMPSLREGLSRSIMEAMATGLPCIVSKIRGNTDLIDDGSGGYTCPANNADFWAEKLDILLNNSALCQKMSEFNRQKIKKFDFSVVEQDLIKIYQHTFL
ncbi:MAG: glycosyltransferase family 4 protein [Clostridia bacterium]|nr:glycosyltransferase family 4 protein [Clostridia bacterium]